MKHWEEYWKICKNKPIVSSPQVCLYGGSNIEPLASIGMSCFLDPVRHKFKENFSILDYGCGAGILSNFISERLNNFTYYGLEPLSNHGKERIDLAKANFNDSRVKFGFIESSIKDCYDRKIDAVVLISVFTHLNIKDIYVCLNNLLPIFDNNPELSIVFSCFTDNISRLHILCPNINDRYYATSHIEIKNIETFCKNNKLKLNKCIDFTAQGGYIHEIYEIKQ